VAEAGAREGAALAQEIALPSLHLQYSQVFVRDLFARKATFHAPRDRSQRDETTLVSK